MNNHANHAIHEKLVRSTAAVVSDKQIVLALPSIYKSTYGLLNLNRKKWLDIRHYQQKHL